MLMMSDLKFNIIDVNEIKENKKIRGYEIVVLDLTNDKISSIVYDTKKDFLINSVDFLNDFLITVIRNIILLYGTEFNVGIADVDFKLKCIECEDKNELKIEFDFKNFKLNNRINGNDLTRNHNEILSNTITLLINTIIKEINDSETTIR